MRHKIINGLLVILFVLFAIVQLNDPDALLWAGLYLLVALLSGFAIWQKYYLPVLFVTLVVGGMGLFYLAPATYEAIINYDANRPTDSTVTHTDNVHTEAIKEFFGLLVALLVVRWHYLVAKTLARN